MQLTIAGWGDVVKNLHLGRALAASVGKNIEIVEHRLAIRRDGHCAAALATSTGILRAVLGLRKVQAEFIRARLQWDVVGEISLPAAAVDDGILSTPDVLNRTLHRVSARKVRIRIPQLARVIDILTGRSGQDMDFFSDGKPDCGFSRL